MVGRPFRRNVGDGWVDGGRVGACHVDTYRSAAPRRRRDSPPSTGRRLRRRPVSDGHISGSRHRSCHRTLSRGRVHYVWNVVRRHRRDVTGRGPVRLRRVALGLLHIRAGRPRLGGSLDPGGSRPQIYDASPCERTIPTYSLRSTTHSKHLIDKKDR